MSDEPTEVIPGSVAEGDAPSPIPSESDVPAEPKDEVIEPTNEEPKEGEEPTEEPTESGGEEPTDEPTDEPELDTSVWGDTGSEIGNNTLTLLQNAEISTEDAKALLYDAVVAGDATKIDQVALEAKVGKAKASLILVGIKGFIQETAEKNSAIKQVVYEAAGGEEAWNKLTTWAETSGTDISEYAGLIDAGGAAARFAVQEITELFNADPKNTAITAGTKRVEPSKGGAAPAIQPITRAEFVEQLDAAHAAGDQKAVDRIKAARAAGRKQGI
jgi:hypothetical protein